MKVVFTVLARRSLQDIYEQIREFSPVAARRTRANILARAGSSPPTLNRVAWFLSSTFGRFENSSRAPIEFGTE